MELDEALALSSGRTAERVRCWREAVPAVLEAGGLPAAAAELLADAAASVLEAYSDQREIHAWLQAVSAIAAREDLGGGFTQALVPRLVASAAASARPALTVAAKLLALRALCAVLRSNFAAAHAAASAARGGFAELVVAQGGVLHAVRDSARKPAHVRTAHAAVRSVLSSVPAAAAEYRAVLFSLEAPGAEACAMAGVLLEPRLRRRLPAEPAERDGWIKLYTSCVLGSSQPISRALADGFGPLIGTASEAEWTERLVPGALKALKRAPDAALATLPSLLGALPPSLRGG